MQAQLEGKGFLRKLRDRIKGESAYRGLTMSSCSHARDFAVILQLISWNRTVLTLDTDVAVLSKASDTNHNGRDLHHQQPIIYYTY